MKKVLVILFISLLYSCSNKVSKESIDTLNGYWQIESVIFTDGTKKEYALSNSVDYIKVEHLKGYRKKVQPKFDGTFETSNDAEPFVIIENNVYEMHYKNDLSAWKETIKSISKNNFSVINEENVTYNYKRFEPFSLK